MMELNPWKITGFIATVVIVLTIPLSLLLNRHAGEGKGPAITFAGGRSCIECHQKEYRLWKGSDHDNAMMPATDSSVLGDFNNAEFTFNGKTSKFYRRGEKFFVMTEGAEGKMKEFEVATPSAYARSSSTSYHLKTENSSAFPLRGTRLRRNGSIWQPWSIRRRT